MWSGLNGSWRLCKSVCWKLTDTKGHLCKRRVVQWLVNCKEAFSFFQFLVQRIRQSRRNSIFLPRRFSGWLPEARQPERGTDCTRPVVVWMFSWSGYLYWPLLSGDHGPADRVA